MGYFKVLICDDDAYYVRSLSRFMAWTKDEIKVSAYTDMSDFLNARGQFDLGLLGKDYIEVYEREKPDVKLKRVLYLCDEDATEYEDMEHLYKFQSMDCFMDRIYAAIRQDDVMKMLSGMKVEKGSSIGVFSPIWHDLRLPFSMALTKAKNNDGKALFVDLETISILPELMGKSVDTDLMDLLYLLEMNNDGSFALEEFVFYFEGIALLPPMRNPGRIGEVTAAQWEKLFMTAEKNGYKLVILMDQMLQGFEEIIGGMKELIILGRPEDYYRKSQAKCMMYLNQTIL